jgi:hypothetical protein
MFAEKYAGGAELTTEALISVCPFPFEKVECTSLTKEVIDNNPDVFWIFGNFANLSTEAKAHFVKNKKYAVLEYDYKFCKYRNPSLHYMEGSKCECETVFDAKLNSLFLHKAQSTWWMSQAQKDIYTNKFSFLEKSNNTVLSSVFSESSLSTMESLDTSEKNNKWIILNSSSPVKNSSGAVDYAKGNDMEYELVWGLEHGELLKKLAESRGLIFLPVGEDTCPRIVIEAKILDCQIIMNNNVQHKDEEWFQGDRESIISFLRNRPSVFWKEINNNVKNSF